MSEPLPLRDRYLAFLDRIVQMTLKGKISSKEQVSRMLIQDIAQGTGEIFERCLGDRISAQQRQLEIQTDEFKFAKANRSLRALKTIQGEWERWQQQNQATETIVTVGQHIAAVPQPQRLIAVMKSLDPNQKLPLDSSQLKQLAKVLVQQADIHADPESAQQLQQLSAGISQGLISWQQLEAYLVSWIYDQSQGQLGFDSIPNQYGPWAIWAKQINAPLPQLLFKTLANRQSVVDLAAQQLPLSLTVWVELAIILRYLQQGLVTWFDKLVYDSKVGAKLSIATFLTFAAIWSQLAKGLSQTERGNWENNQGLAKGCFQMTLQILRAFAQRDYFPLYGGIFASLSGDYLRDALNYLDEPLTQSTGTEEKARILTLLGASRRVLGDFEGANIFHQQALEIAQAAEDRRCEIANFNHLSRTRVDQRNYTEAIHYSQRALVLSRQVGDRVGEANALVNLGYSEVFQARQERTATIEMCETAVAYLQQGLAIVERLGDRQSQALCLSSLGIAYVILEQPNQALTYLEGGLKAAQFSGDLYFQGLNLAYLATAHYRLQNLEQAIYQGCLGMYLLEQIASSEWCQPAGLLLVLRGQVGSDAFQTVLEQHRSRILAIVGIDGYDHIPDLLEQYRSSLEDRANG